VDDSSSTDEDTPVVVSVVIPNDSDPDGDQLTLVGISGPIKGGSANILDALAGTIEYT